MKKRGRKPIVHRLISKGAREHIESELEKYLQGEAVAVGTVSGKYADHLKEIQEAIGRVYLSLPDEKKRLIAVRYWTRPQTLTWDGIAIEINTSRMTAIRWKNEIVEKIADELGWR